jgi:hypothetical protein
MNYNPYGSDGTAAAGSSGDSPPGPAQPWEPGEVLKGALEIFKIHWAPLVLAPLIASIVFLVFGGALFVYIFATGAKGDDLGVRSASLVLGVLMVLIFPYFEAGLLRMWLSAARGETPDVAQVFSGFDRYPHLLSLRVLFAVPAFLLSSLALLCGFAGLSTLDTVFTVFGNTAQGVLVVLQALGLYYADYFVVDAKLNPVDALKRAWLTTAPFRAQLLLFSIIAGVITFAAAMCCALPLLVATPIVAIATSTVYLRVTGQSTPPMGSPFGSGFAGGGYTPPPGPSAPF